MNKIQKKLTKIYEYAETLDPTDANALGNVMHRIAALICELDE
jgi:hypothetical protein